MDMTAAAVAFMFAQKIQKDYVVPPEPRVEAGQEAPQRKRRSTFRLPFVSRPFRPAAKLS
jgi:hypothetical protein